MTVKENLENYVYYAYPNKEVKINDNHVAIVELMNGQVFAVDEDGMIYDEECMIYDPETITFKGLDSGKETDDVKRWYAPEE